MKRISWNRGITKVKPKLCLCGCGELLPLHIYTKKDGISRSYQVFSFISRHKKRGIDGFDHQIHSPRLCLCGCGRYTQKHGSQYYRFIKGHENIGRTAWNKGKPFPIEIRKRMSIARLGKSPANKMPVDLNKIKELYFDKYPKRALKDKLRKKFLQSQGYQIEEIWEHDIKQNGVDPVMNKFIEKYKL